MARAELAGAKRVVLKVGSSSLTQGGAGLDAARIEELATAVAQRRAAGAQVVVVSSGAIAAGIVPLGLRRRPRDLATQQAAASVGQLLLVEAYAAAFARRDLTVGQVLLTSDDVTRRVHYRNARTTLERLLDLGVVPIVNENDAVATDEIRMGDNDRLAALVAHLVAADALVVLSDVDGVYDGDPRATDAARLVTDVRSEADLAGLGLGGVGSGVGSGGMASKVEAARLAAGAGVHVVIGPAARAAEVLAGDEVGTHFHPTGARITSRLLWLAHATRPHGRLLLDPGAVTAVVERRVSLLPVGVTGVEGEFVAGDPVELVDATSGGVIGRGIVQYDAAELPALLGRSTKDLAAELGPAYEREVVHRDDLVVS